MTNVALALREVREQQGLTQQQVGEMAYVSNKLISEVERGNRRLPKDAARRIAHKTGAGRLFLALVADATGGVFSPGPLDGVDTHPAAVFLKSKEEIEELLALEETVRTALTKPKHLLTDAERQACDRYLDELLDVITCLQEKACSMCDHIDRPITELYERHDRKLVAKGYKTKRAPIRTP